MKIILDCETEGCDGLDFKPDEIVFVPNKEDGTVDIFLGGAKIMVDEEDFEELCQFFVSRRPGVLIQ